MTDSARVSNPPPSVQAGTTLLVWDSARPPPQGAWIVALWRDFSTSDSRAFSVPQHLERRAQALRERFLSWIYELGQLQIGGQRLLDHFGLRPGFSFWWTTLLSEKSNAFNSPQIITALKLMALEDWIGREWRGRLVLMSDDRILARALRLWCRSAGREFRRQRAGSSKVIRRTLTQRLYGLLPHSVQALAALVRYLLWRWPLRNAGTSQLQASTARMTFCSYLFNLDKNAATEGRFYSSFWTQLHAVLESASANWLLLFIEHDYVPTTRRARALIEQFNRGGPHAHAVLDAALSLDVVIAAVRDYTRVVLAAWRVRSVRWRFKPENSDLDLWPVFEWDWNRSVFGAVAILNCLALNLFERTLRRLPHQQLGVYLQENIGWETAFVYCWKAAGHGKLIGAPHSTVRFWDLRYFFDPRTYRYTGHNDLPLPDIVALNGPAAIDLYLCGGFPVERLAEVEALRYLHLAKLAAAHASAARGAAGPLRVLVLGDYVQSVTQQQMQWLVQAARKLPADTRYLVKPHPACPIDPGDYPMLNMQLTDESLDKLFGDCDVAYTSNMTSAAVDAHCAGVAVISVLDGEAFNISPLRGMRGVNYVTSAVELAQALGDARQLGAERPEGYFCLDRELPRWRGLLGLSQGPSEAIQFRLRGGTPVS